MDWLKKLPNSVRSKSGLEWKLWRKLPLIFAAGTLLPVLVALFVHALTEQDMDADLRWLQTMDYVVAGVVVFHWSAMLALAIGCVVVMLMKGPGYVADAMELSDSEQPRKTAEPPAPK